MPTLYPIELRGRNCEFILGYSRGNASRRKAAPVSDRLRVTALSSGEIEMHRRQVGDQELRGAEGGQGRLHLDVVPAGFAGRRAMLTFFTLDVQVAELL